jgi:predicted XRE-type DNA-binding protein
MEDCFQIKNVIACQLHDDFKQNKIKQATSLTLLEVERTSAHKFPSTQRQKSSNRAECERIHGNQGQPVCGECV